MGQALRELGWQVASRPAAVPGGPDVIVVNSCAVTGRAAAKSRQAARSYARRFPASRVVLCGCYPQTDPDAARAVSGIAMIAGTGRKATVDALHDLLGAAPDITAASLSFDLGPEFESLPVAPAADRVRANLKVQEGCEAGCVYCVVPLARGPQRSLPLPAALDQAQALLRQGACELVITGIRLGAYGHDLNDGSSLATLLRACARLDGLRRLRLSSLEPGDVEPAILQAMADCQPVVCPHLHLPMQSGSDAVLAAMGRDYDSQNYLNTVALARKMVPGLAVSADVLAGFPGETESDSQATIDLVRAAGLMRLHVFPFSARPGTRASVLPGQLTAAAKESRARQLTQVGRELALAYHSRWIGRQVEVLLEADPEPRAGPQGCTGFGNEGLTADYVRVETWGSAPRRAGETVPVEVVAVSAAGMSGLTEASPRTDA
jgi:threonylcarbamoyladenosine tRNA methylthiotransferase MtaB